jgi:transcription elongation factor GreA
MADSIPMTRAGYEKLKAELQHMDGVLMPEIAEKIAQARGEGDLKENAEYHAQREAQGQLQAKINLLRDKLSRATIYDTSNSPKDQVAFGATVTVKDLAYGDEEEYSLVGAGEEDYDKGKILITSPMGQGLLGKRIGEIAEIQAPKGKIRFEIVSIRYEE